MSCVPSPLSRVSSALRISWAVPLCHLSLRRGASFRFSSSGRARQPCSHSVLAVYCLVVGCFYHALFLNANEVGGLFGSQALEPVLFNAVAKATKRTKSTRSARCSQTRCSRVSVSSRYVRCRQLLASPREKQRKQPKQRKQRLQPQAVKKGGGGARAATMMEQQL